MKVIKVFGHKSPDTDAVASTLVWDWFLRNHRKIDSKAYILSQPNNEAVFVLEKWGFSMPELLEEVTKEDNVCIVDTNNADELFPNINDTNITSIIDHHKLTGGLKTSSPLEVVIQPYASTMTVMFNVMNIEVKDFPKEIAGLMLSGIVSDTLLFRSPTTTQTDKDLALAIAESLQIDISKYADEMFEAKSDISGFSNDELVRLDSKIFEIKGENIRISVIETTKPQTVFERIEGIKNSMQTIKKEDSVDHILMFVVDILNQEAHFLTNEDEAKKISLNAFGVEAQEDVTILPGIVSRKKQIISVLSK